MAASSSLCNLFSFLNPSKLPSQPKTPPTQLPILQTQKTRDGVAPLMAQGGPSAYGPSSSSSSSSVESVICPSLAYANTLFFKSAYNVQVIVDDNEPEERLINRFRREVMRAGLIQETKRRRYFENKQDEKKRRTRDAAKRNKRSRRPFSRPFQQKPEVPETKKSDDDGDNWDLPQGDIPY
ncbi:uncharacterized protein Pyn_35420 [Prunus yedoensis var. nudiflora]|uniref:Uncharacterized protein n=1 Tax=Prunus yedoensis var. nudiflora TaxID=2094558 RepID=A0A314XKN7_PRUYE|nr:uncharacterized protein Pyn_35420 [Prunus yedoensis var. nudiflora]